MNFSLLLHGITIVFHDSCSEKSIPEYWGYFALNTFSSLQYFVLIFIYAGLIFQIDVMYARIY